MSGWRTHEEQTGDDLAPTMLVAELTHRCSLGCPYCSNPLVLARQEDELDLATWSRVFVEAAALGVRSVRLSGGEPGLRRDLVEIASSAREAGLHTSLITSGVGIATRTMRDLWEAGLHEVHVSFQDSDAVAADRLAGRQSAFQRKHALATEAVRLGMSLTIQFVLHRANIERIDRMIDLALSLRANGVELMPMRLEGWAARNAGALTPDQESAARAALAIVSLVSKYRDRIDVQWPADGVGEADGGKGLRQPQELIVRPAGEVLPCDDGRIPGFDLWNVRTHALAEIWRASPAFLAVRPSSDRIGASSRIDRRSNDTVAPHTGSEELPLIYRR